MDIGKLPNSVLRELILKNIDIRGENILIPPSIGEDCSAISFGESCCVLTTDPITGTSKNIGNLAVNISCNDIASSGALPIALLVNILIPTSASVDDVTMVIQEINKTAASLGVDIIGGHTEVTNAVNKFVIVTTGVGKTLTDNLIKTSGAKPDDVLIMTKTAGLEGTSIIACEKEEDLHKIMSEQEIKNAKSMIDEISVVKEGSTCASHGVHSMHDATEGGILGAIWEMAESSGIGIKVYGNSIPIAKETSAICNFYNINPLKLISSGSLLIATDKGDEIIGALYSQGIQASVIGRFIKNPDKIIVWEDNKTEKIYEPESDELFKVI
jgi:hydrogenase maturation factor